MNHKNRKFEINQKITCISIHRLTQSAWKERIVLKCIESKISLYSPHTAWDSCEGGVNDWLIESLPIVKKTCIPVIPSTVISSFEAGRMAKIDEKLTLSDAVEKIKKYTGLNNLHVAISQNGTLESPVCSVAVCAGSGSSVLKDAKADLFISGEMSHHEVLNFVHNNINVILLNHSNSERGFLKKFKDMLPKILENNDIEIIISESDVDPLKTL